MPVAEVNVQTALCAVVSQWHISRNPDKAIVSCSNDLVLAKV